MKRFLTAALALAVALPCAAQPQSPPSEKELPAAAPDEAHGLTGVERDAALLVLRSHYQNFLESFSTVTLTGLDRSDFSKPASCEFPIVIDPGSFTKGSFVDGLPVRRAQPALFNVFQRQMIQGAIACQSKILFTPGTWADLEAQNLAYLLKNSGTTYCRIDEDCYGMEIGADACGARPAVRVFGSNTTDAVLFIAFRKFMPPLMSNVQQAVMGTIMSLGDKHPNHDVLKAPNRCPMRHWSESPLKSACVQNSCRAAGTAAGP